MAVMCMLAIILVLYIISVCYLDVIIMSTHSFVWPMIHYTTGEIY